MASAWVKWNFTAFFLAVALAAPAQAGPYEDAVAAYNRGDYTTAEKLFRKAADQGHAQAQFKLGVMYSSGEEGVLQEEDDTEAVKWYRKAAEQGFAVAQLYLGFMYEQGLGVPRDDSEAAEWYRKAAEQGDADAQFDLGFMYDEGRGVRQDYVQAHKWYSLAISQLVAGEDRDSAVENRNKVASRMSSAQIAEAQRLTREWKPK